MLDGFCLWITLVYSIADEVERLAWTERLQTVYHYCKVSSERASAVVLLRYSKVYIHEVGKGFCKRRSMVSVCAPDEELDRSARILRGMAHEGMSALFTEYGDNLLITLLLCNVEGCCARRVSIPFMSSLHVLFFPCKELHTLNLISEYCQHEGRPSVTILHPTLLLQQ